MPIPIAISRHLTNKILIDENYFKINENIFKIYKIVFKVLFKKNKIDNSFIRNIFCDPVNCFVTFVSYFDIYKDYDEYAKIDLDIHRERFNSLLNVATNDWFVKNNLR